MSAREFIPLGVLEEQILVAVLRTGDEAFGMEFAARSSGSRA